MSCKYWTTNTLLLHVLSSKDLEKDFNYSVNKINYSFYSDITINIIYYSTNFTTNLLLTKFTILLILLGNYHKLNLLWTNVETHNLMNSDRTSHRSFVSWCSHSHCRRVSRGGSTGWSYTPCWTGYPSSAESFDNAWTTA